jgi:peptidoglycan/LPS O-acetylase OafA/YrhL
MLYGCFVRQNSVTERSTYRSDIDGLRAVAVCSVVIGHLFPQIAQNGFLGVDIFFVISGFVISQLMMNMEKRSIYLFLLEFYAKRIRRLLPALFAVVISCFTLISLLQAQVKEEVIRAGSFSILGFSNMYLYLISTDYFGSDASLNPFTHTWSLGVEEQFYFLYPILFILMWKIARTRFQSSLIVLIASITFISLFVNYIFASSNPNLAFYSMPTRLWELGFGALAYFIKDKSFHSQRYLILFQNVALSLVFAILAIPADFGITGQIVVAALTVGILLAGGRGKHTGFLTNRTLGWLGKRSYSIYLIHWPILVLMSYVLGLNKVENILLLPIILILGSLSFRYIENPFRTGKFKRPAKKTLTFGLILTIASSIVMLSIGTPLIASKGGLIPRVIGIQSLPKWEPSECSGARNVKKLRDPIVNCLGGSRASSKKYVYLIGDSHADQLIPMVKKTFQSTDYEVKNLNMENGIDFPYGELLPENKSPSLKFLERNAKKGDVVILAFHRGRLNPSRDEHLALTEQIRMTPQTFNLISNLNSFSKVIKDLGVKVILIKDTPLMQTIQSSQACALQRKILNREACEVTEIQDKKTRFLQNFAFEEVSEKNTNVSFWDPLEYVYQKSGKLSVLASDGSFVMWDWNHITPEYAVELYPSFQDFSESFLGADVSYQNR